MTFTPPRILLSIDGGGIRGVIPAKLIQFLEDELKKQIDEKFNTQQLNGIPCPPTNRYLSFDLVAGTSTGGILSLGVGIPGNDHPRQAKYQANVLGSLYEKNGSKIFNPQTSKGFISSLFSPKHSEEPIEQVFEEYFGDCEFKSLIQPTLITAYEIHSENLHVFDNTNKNKNYLVKDLARATSAAPTFFKAKTVEDLDKTESKVYIDGGVTANNPSQLAYMRAMELYPNEQIIVISLGCGYNNLFTIDSKQNGGLLNYAKDISGLIMTSTSNLTDYYMQSLTRIRQDQYYRVQFNIDSTIAGLDNSDSTNINYLIGVATKAIRDRDNAIHKALQQVLQIYQNCGNYLSYRLINELGIQQSTKVIDLTKYEYLTKRELWEIAFYLKELNVQQLDKVIFSITKCNLEIIELFSCFPIINELYLERIDFTIIENETSTELGRKLFQYYSTMSPTETSHQNNILLFKANPKILNDLAVMYYTNSSDVLKSFDLLSECSTNNIKESQLLLSKMKTTQSNISFLIEKGRLPSNYSQSDGIDELYLLATSTCRPAYYHLARMLEKDFGALSTKSWCPSINGRFQAAKQWYDSVIDYYKLTQESFVRFYAKTSCLNIANLYENNMLTNGNSTLQEALKYYRMASELGSESANEKIQKIEKQLNTITKD